MIAAAVSFGVLAGLIAWQANLATYNNYHKIVDVGSVSVDFGLASACGCAGPHERGGHLPRNDG